MSEPKVEIICDNKLQLSTQYRHGESYTISLKNLISGRLYTMTAYVQAFSNCQNWQIASFYQLLEVCQNLNVDPLEVLEKIASHITTTPQLWIDVKRPYHSYILNNFPIYFMQRYESTNNTLMTMYSLDLRPKTIKEWRQNKQK